MKDAKAAHTKALAEAKVAKVANEGATDSANKVNNAVNEANKDINEANYKAAKERCDTFAGSVKDRCISDLKIKFGKM